MDSVRFKLEDVTSTDEYDELGKKIVGVKSDSISIQPARPTPGAPLATVVLVALIAGGATIIAASINVFGNYLIARAQRREERRIKAEEGTTAFPKAIIIRGPTGSVRVESADDKFSEAAIKAAVESLGTVTEVVEAPENES